MDDRDDRQLKALFQERRMEEREDVPSFESVWRAAKAESPSQPARRWRPAYALAIAVAVAAVFLAVFLLGDATDTAPEALPSDLVAAAEYDELYELYELFEVDDAYDDEWGVLLALADWESPTDFLLQSNDAWFFESDE